MKITDERKGQVVKFKEVELGQVFECPWCSGIYMRMPCVKETISGTYADYNAINLSDGMLSYFEDDDKIVILKTELKIVD